MTYNIDNGKIHLEILNQEVYNKRPKLPRKEKQKWIKALLSDAYQQGFCRLSSSGKFCCLGVLCCLQERPITDTLFDGTFVIDGSEIFLTEKNPLFEVLGQQGFFQGFTINGETSLSTLNDWGYDFVFISKIIKKYF